jgi:hypothetical protein
MESPLVDGQPYRQKMEFRNSGRTPAVTYQGAAVTFMVPCNWKASFTYAHGTRIEGRVIDLNAPPQVAYSVLIPENAPPGRQITATRVDENMRRALASSEFNLVTFGRIDYGDVFGGHHWFTFCVADTAKAEGTNWWEDCVRYNDIDRN